MRPLHAMVLILAALLVAMLPAASASANDMDTFGLGARQIALGGAVTGYVSDPSAVYYNPSGLVNSRHLNLSLGYSFADYGLQLDSQNGGALDDRAERLRDLSAATMGMSTVLPPGDEDALFAVGMAFFVPLQRLIEIEETTASSDPEFALYGPSRDRLGMYMCGAWRVNDWLALGAGLTVFADSEGQNVNTVLGAEDQIVFQQDASHDAAPIVGMLFEPTDTFSLGLTFRGELSTKVDFLSVTNDLVAVTIESITFFSPNQVAVGAAWDVIDDLTLLVDVSWLEWSAFQDAFLVATANGAAVGNRVRSGFDDIIIPRLGVELQTTSSTMLRFGYFYHPTPAPEQDGATNLIDNDKHVFSLGLGYVYDRNSLLRKSAKPKRRLFPPRKDVTEEAAAADSQGEAEEEGSLLDTLPVMNLDVFVQYHFLIPRDHEKIDPADPIGDVESKGWILNVGFQLTLRF